MRALRLNAWSTTPVLEEVPDPVAGPGEVIVKIGAAGACHSDLHFIHEFAEGIVPWFPPFTLGHENAGWVHQVGDGVTGLQVGQPVAVYGAWGCGHCARCRVGIETQCENPEQQPVPGGGGGLGLDGGMADYLKVPNARLIVPLPDGLSPVDAAPLTDAGLTPYHAVRRSLAKLMPGSTCVVIGVGGLGHMAVQFLKAITAAKVIAVDPRAEARALATTMGADVAVDSTEDATAAIMEATKGRGAEVVLDFVGIDETLQLGLSVSRPLGDLTIVGVGGGTLAAGFFTLPFELSVQSIYWGTRPELYEVLDLASRGLIKPKVTTFALEDAVEAYDLLHEGKIEGRAVIVP